MKLRLLMALAVLLASCGGGTAETTLEVTTTLPPSTVSQPSLTTVDPTTTSAITTTTAVTNLIRVEGGAKVEGPDTISVTQGEIVNFQVMTDVADEVHVHGYDLFFETIPGEPVTVELTADATGIFEVELEGDHLGLVNIEVTP